ncbi:hypothetical protein V6Z11_D07G007900 [Gossypium hirsutum]
MEKVDENIMFFVLTTGAPLILHFWSSLKALGAVPNHYYYYQKVK